MSDLLIVGIAIGIAASMLFDFLFLRWLRRRPGRKFELCATPPTEPPCWPYGWPDE